MKFVAVTACPTGIAHSQMAAENLENTAEERGHDMHVEVHGAMGTENEIPDDVLAAADAVIIASDTSVQTDRFGGLPVVKGSVKDGVNDPGGLIDEAVERAEGGAEESTAGDAGTAGATGDGDAGTTGTTGGEDAGTVGADAEDQTAGSEPRSADRSSSDGGLVARLKKLFS